MLFKIINNQIDCTDLVEGVRYHVPRRQLRSRVTFAQTYTRKNYCRGRFLQRATERLLVDIDIFHLPLMTYRRECARLLNEVNE